MRLGKYEGSSASSDPDNYARVYLAEGETGWVEKLDPGYVRIANIPYDGEYNIDDVVKVDVEAMLRDPNQILKGTIEKRPFPVRTILLYPKVSDFKKISAMVKKMDGKMEGAIGPRGGNPGFLALAAKKKSDVLKIVRDLELSQGKGWRPNFLQD